MNLLKTATAADFSRVCKIVKRLCYCLLCGSLSLAYLSSIPFPASAQSTAVPTTTNTLPCQHYFLLKLSKNTSIPPAGAIESIFKQHGFTQCSIDEKKSAIQLTCPKGCTVAAVKEVIDELKLEVSAIKEEYTNKKTPAIFE